MQCRYRDAAKRLNERMSSLLSNVVSTSAAVAERISDYFQQQKLSSMTSLTTGISRHLSVTSSGTDLDPHTDDLVNGRH